MDHPDPDPYVSYTSHPSNKSKRKKESKKRRQSQSSNPEATAADAAAAERSLDGSRPGREASAGTPGHRDGRSGKRKRRQSSSSQRSAPSEEAKSSAAVLDAASKQGTEKPTEGPGSSAVDKDLHGDPKATAPDAAAPERSMEVSRTVREPPSGTPGKREGGSTKRKRRRSSSSQRSGHSDEVKPSGVALASAAQQGTDKPTEVSRSSAEEKDLHGGSKPAEEVTPSTAEHSAVAQSGTHAPAGAAAPSRVAQDEHADTKVVCLLPDEAPKSQAAVSTDKAKQPDAPMLNVGVNEVAKAPLSGPSAPHSDGDMGSAAHDESRQRLFGAAALCVLALSSMSAVLVLMFLLQAWDNEVRLNVPSLGVFLGTRGFVENSPVYIFRAIPFARGTSGRQRFARATPVNKISGLEIDARMSQPGCIQKPYVAKGKVLRHNEDTSEECLHLNIWTPCIENKQADCRKTVLVFFHSIEFQTGDNNYYDGQWLAALGQLVVVSPNFRQGAFGFLKLGCPRNDIPCAPGDVALDDQRLALEWVVAHIGSFGGNASDVVLMGSASGAWSLGSHLLTANADSAAGDDFWNHERFSKVILMSESPLRRYYGSSAGDLATALGCPRDDAGEELLCLRNARARDLVAATSERARFFGPTQAPSLQSAAAVSGRSFFLGAVSGEGSHNLDIIAREPGPLQQNVIAFLQTAHHMNHSSELAEVYRNAIFLPGQADSNRRWAKELLGDVAYTCPLLRLGRELASGGRNHVYAYIFDHRPSFTLFNDSATASRFAELDFVFGRPLDGSRRGTPEERQFSRQVINIWASFARSGLLPSIDGKPWPMYSKEKAVHVRIAMTQLEEVSDFKKKDCSVVAAFIPEDSESTADASQTTTQPTSDPSAKPIGSANATVNTLRIGL